jgi:phage-related protein
MGFDVGTITAKMELDRSPFNAGLDRAKEDVKRFEDEHHAVTEHVDLKGLEEAKAELERLHAEQEDRVRVNVDDERAKAELERLKLELDRLNHERVTPTVKVDTSRANADIRTLTGSVTRLGAVASIVGRSTMPALIAGLVGLAPVVVPAVGAVTAAAVGMSGAFVAAGAGAAAFGLVAKSMFTSAAQDASKLNALQQQYNQAVDNKQRQQILKQEQVLWSKIPPEQARTVLLMQQLQQTWQGLGEAARPFVNRLLQIAVGISQQVRPAIQGLVTAGGSAFVQLGHQAQAALAGPFWQQFLRFLQGQAKPAILAFGGSFGDVAHGMAALTMAFQPLEARFLSGMSRMSASFSQWASSLANSRGFQSFLASIQRDIPVVMGFLKALGGAAIQLVKQLEPVGRTVLQGLTPVFQQLGRDMPTIGQGFAALGRFAVVLLRNIEPLIPAIARLLVALEPLATVIVNALGTAIKSLEPVFAALIHALTPVAQTLFPVLARVIQGLAPVVARLITGLAPLALTLARMAAGILPALVPILGAAVTAFLRLLGALRPIQGPLVQLAVAFGRLLAAVLPAMLGMMNATLPLVRVLASGLAPVLRVIADFLQSPFARALFTVIALLMNPIPAAIAVAKAALQGLQTVASAVATAVVAVWNVAKAGLTAVWHAISAVARTVWTLIKDIVTRSTPSQWIQAAWHAIAGVLSSIWHGISSVASSVWNAIEHAITGPVNAVWSFLASAWHAIESAATSVWHGILSAATSLWHSIANAITAPVNWVISWLGGVFNWFYNAGKNIVEGLISGVGSMGQWLVNKLVDIVKSAFGGVLHFLGITSPSKLMHGVGVYMIQGLAGGITAAGPMVQGALNRAVGGLRVPTLIGTVGMGAGAGSPGAAVPAVGTAGVGGTPQINVTVGTLHAGNPTQMRAFEMAIVNAGRQVQRAQGRRGG